MEIVLALRHSMLSLVDAPFYGVVFALRHATLSHAGAPFYGVVLALRHSMLSHIDVCPRRISLPYNIGVTG